jgi:hypothetical protein
MQLGQLLEWLGLRSRHIERRRTMAAGFAPKRFLRALFRASSESCRYGRYSVSFAADADYADPAQSTWEVQRFFAIHYVCGFKSPRCAGRLSGLILPTGVPEL